MLIGISAVAVCLGLGRYGGGQDDNRVLAAVVFGSLATALVSSFTTLPAAMAVLRARRPLVAAPVLLATNSLVLGAYVIVLFLIDRHVPPMGTFLLEAAALVISFTVCLSIPLLIVHRLGYRLRWGRE
jgi:hypothetical protein